MLLFFFGERDSINVSLVMRNSEKRTGITVGSKSKKENDKREDRFFFHGKEIHFHRYLIKKY